MACVQFKLPSWLKNKIQGKSCESEDYIYLKWEFKTNGNSGMKSMHRKEEKRTYLSELPSISKFKDIHSWLLSQDIPLQSSSLHDSKCSCCESKDIHYSCVDVTASIKQSQMINSSRFNSETSLLSTDDSVSEESYYSLQLRDQSRIWFR